MSNLRNRFLALAIVVVMLVAALSSTAFAATTLFSDISDADQTKMVKLLSALQIVLGRGEDEDGNQWFDTDGLVTRQEMAMFLARINSATPGAFNDKEASALTKLPFTDVKDSTFFLAIEYCYQQGIILGATADTYNPNDSVTLDQALAMIVRALGYKDIDTSKNFIESTKKAKELDFARSYKDNQGSKKLTRIEVIELLYKYFYSDEQSLEVVKNETTGVQVTQRVPHPVMEKFGINVNDAYIVRSNDYTANISTATMLTPNDDTLTLPAVNIPRLTTSDVAAGRTMILAYNNYKVIPTSNTGVVYLNGDSTSNKYTTINGYTYTGKWTYIAVNPNELEGLAEKYTDREVVGLKVVYYQDTMAATRPEALGVLSYVKGTRTAIAIEDMSANMKDTLSDGFSDFSKALTILGVTYDLTTNYGRERDLTDADVYKFNDSTTLSAGSSNSIETLKEIGGFIKQKGYFTLECVVNETNSDGEATESYFVYTPYKTGYYEKDDDGNYVFLNGNRGESKYKFNDADSTKNHKLTFAKDSGATKLTTGEAYLYTIEDKNITIFKKLYMQVDNLYPEYIYDGSIKFSNTNAISIGGNNSKIALGASTSVNDAKYSSGATHRAFSYDRDGKIFFVVRTSDATTWTDISNKYGVLTSKPTGATAYLASGSKYLWSYQVYTYEHGYVITMASEYIVDDVNKFNAGMLVSWQKVGDYYRIGAFNSTRELASSTNGQIIVEQGDTCTLGYDPFSSTNTMKITTNNSKSPASALTGIINNSTQILVAEYTIDPSSKAFIDFVRARKFTKNDFDVWMSNNKTAKTFGVDYTIEMITDANGTSWAKTILLSIPVEATKDSYVTITKNNFWSGTYAAGEGYNYKNNAGGIKVAVTNAGSNLRTGDIVKLSDAKTTLNGTEYTIATRVSDMPSYGTAPNDGGYTQPSNLIENNGRLVGKTVGAELNAALAEYYAYPIYNLDSSFISSKPASAPSTETSYKTTANIDIWKVTLEHTTDSTRNPNIVYYSAATPDLADLAVLEEINADYRVSSSSKAYTIANGTTISETLYKELIGVTIKVDAYTTISGATDTTSATFAKVNPLGTAALTTGSIDTIINTTASSDRMAVSILSGNKFNFIKITVDSNNKVTKVEWDHNDDKVRSFNDTFGSNNFRIANGYIGNTVNSNTEGLNTAAGPNSTAKWYVITNNTDGNVMSDIITIIKVVK